MLPFVVFLDDPAVDGRFAVPMSFEERFLPLSDFANRIGKETRVKVWVEPGVAERKLALFVRDRSAAEIMRQAADATGTHWTREDDGWRLAAEAGIAQEEAEEAEIEDRARHAALLDWAQRLGPKEKANDAEQRTASLFARLGSRKAAEALWSGQTLAATADGRLGTTRLDMPEPEPIRSGNETVVLAASPDFLAVRYDPWQTRVDMILRGFGRNVKSGIPASAELLRDRRSIDTALRRRLDAWAKEKDPTPLKPLPLPPCRYPSGLLTLSDALARLHARTRLPIVAETFRLPLGAYRELPGTSVETCLRALRQSAVSKPLFAPDLRWRREGTWLSARFVSAWRLRLGEISESELEPLEKRPPTIDDYAALAGRLAPPQRAALEDFRPVVSFPLATLRQGYWGLYVYDALPRSARTAASVRILPFSALPALAQRRWDEAVGALSMDMAMPEAWLEALLAKGSRPPGAGVFVGGGQLQTAVPQEYPTGLRIGPQDGKRRVWKTWVFSFGSREGDRDVLSLHASLGEGEVGNLPKG